MTVVLAPSVTVHGPVPEQPPPLQPAKREPAPGVAVSVTTVPPAKEAEHVESQEIPAGALVTVPLPAPLGLTVSVKVGTKVAVTTWAAFIVTVQEPLPLQAPLQPMRAEPTAGVAVRVTAVPLANEAEHVAPQEIPAGALVTVPLPAPLGLTISVKSGTKVAVTVVFAPSVTVQVLVLEQPPPLQPVKVEPAVGVAVSVTTVPLVNEAEHDAPQAMPVGALVTVPLPAPLGLTVSVKSGTKVAVTVVSAPSVTVHGPVPAQPPPLQPVKAKPALGVAVSVTAVPLANVAEHVAPQAIPAGALVTVPLPAPPRFTVNV